MSREDDIKKVCFHIIDSEPDFYDDPNGPYYHICPYCRKRQSFSGDETGPTMQELQHDNDCIWLIAKDLMTGIKK